MFGQRHLAAALGPAEIFALVDGHPQQPGLQMFTVLKALAAAQQGLKDLLGYILRVL